VGGVTTCKYLVDTNNQVKPMEELGRAGQWCSVAVLKQTNEQSERWA